MAARKVISGLLGSVLCTFILIGCTETAVQPVGESQNSIVTASTAAITAINNELSLVETAGVSVDTTTAVFSINWREFFHSSNQVSSLVGRAYAVGPTAGFFRGGADMGSVYLNFSGNHLTLQKRTDRQGGVAYSTFEGRCDSAANTNVSFVSGGAYEFEATGATGFSALKATIVAPTALLAFEGVTNGSAISTTTDLTLSWTGGNSGGPILLTLMAERTNGPGKAVGPDSLHRLDSLRGPGGRHGRGHGADGPEVYQVADGGRFGSGPDIGDPAIPFDSSRTLIISLTGNPGKYTIPAADLQAFVTKTNATQVNCMVSQVTKVVQPHDTGYIKLVVGNDDQVHLLIK